MLLTWVQFHDIGSHRRCLECGYKSIMHVLVAASYEKVGGNSWFHLLWIKRVMYHKDLVIEIPNF